MVAAVLAGLGFGVWRLVGSNDEPPSPDPAESLPPLPTDPDLDFSPVPEETGGEGGTGSSPSPGALPSPTAPSTTVPAASPGASPGATLAPPPPGTRIQVLDGAGSGIRAAQAKQQIQGAGYAVVAEGATSRPYEKTTVFYQPGNEQLARDVAALVGATDVLVAPANLDKSIPLAVVIGSDYPG